MTMISAGGPEAVPSLVISTPCGASEETGNVAIVSPANSPPPSPNPVKSKTTVGLELELDAEEVAKSIEDIQSEFSNDVKRKLPEDFVPSSYSIICGRGKECFESEGVSAKCCLMITFFIAGMDNAWSFDLTEIVASDFLAVSYAMIQNKRFRVIINNFLEEYTEAHGKSEKSKLVSKAMDIIREKCPKGAFVKREKGQWYEVSPRYAREKVGKILELKMLRIDFIIHPSNQHRCVLNSP